LSDQNGGALWDWITNHLTSVEYPVNEKALAVLTELSRYASEVIVNTGRPEGARVATERWLRRFFRVDRLLMRSPQDFRTTAIVKRDNLVMRILPARDCGQIYAFDDNEHAVRMYLDAGITALSAPECWSRLLGSILNGCNSDALKTVLTAHAFSPVDT
jgi:hypothetical protein